MARLTDKARKALFAKGAKRNRSIELSSQTRGGPRMPDITSAPDIVRTPKLSTASRKSKSWAGA